MFWVRFPMLEPKPSLSTQYYRRVRDVPTCNKYFLNKFLFLFQVVSQDVNQRPAVQRPSLKWPPRCWGGRPTAAVWPPAPAAATASQVAVTRPGQHWPQVHQPGEERQRQKKKKDAESFFLFTKTEAI